VKKTESLAIENIRRIAEQLREERNNAIAIGQVVREDLEAALTLLKEVKALDLPLADAQKARIQALIDKER
jgi:hypothetical protein